MLSIWENNEDLSFYFGFCIEKLDNFRFSY